MYHIKREVKKIQGVLWKYIFRIRIIEIVETAINTSS